ncbi:MIF4G-like domain superfamily [Abeliophyllum distichum]|uniref:MIF4G-like domain superfamily n=1 Tax=Abeliophyllum distichum TaxID=126358 RepID=A0ABD1V4K9_9LAMI
MYFEKSKDCEKQEQRHDYSLEYRKFKWDALQKTMFRLINKVSISNIHQLVGNFLNENLIVGRGGEKIDKEIEDIEEQLHVQECEVTDEVDDEISQQNVGVSIEQEILAEAKSKMPQNVEKEVE